MEGIVVAILLAVIVAVPVSVLWVHGIDQMKNNPEWQKHRNDPDFWENL